jgi:diguanylate cyclase (GGDEF)-like protein
MTRRNELDAASPTPVARPSGEWNLTAPSRVGVIPTLDGALAAALERVTRVAAATLGVPATVVALLGDDRRAFTGGPGVPTWLARDPGALLRSGLSARLMDAPGPVTIADARAEPVHGISTAARDLEVAGFLGMYLRSADGDTSALFCALDGRRRDWSSDEIRLFGEVAASALTELELQRRLVEAARIERQLRHDALHDRLTGLPNRTFLVERLKLALERGRRHRDSCALLFVDLDNFKAVNESYGHHAGDELLAEVARRLNTALRATDMLSRLGGDEFALLLEGITDPSDAARIADRLQETLRAPIHIGDVEIFTSASIGIALPGGPDETPQRLLRSADTAMYRAKEQGRARFEVFDATMHAVAMRRLTLETELRRALERRQLALHYQPVVSLRTKRIVAVEALLRWTHPERGMIPPSEFIPVAERAGIIVEIGAWVLAEACGQLQRWTAAHGAAAPEAVGVNLSVKQLGRHDLALRVKETLDTVGLAPHRLKLEITESMMIEDVDAALRAIGELKALGVRILIDDFGTGYSSLSYLARLAPDGIKVDRSFVAQMGTSDGSAALVRGIVALIGSLGLDSIAEGVETPEQLRALVDMGCTHAQGYHLARPMPPDALEPLFSTNKSPASP